MNIEIQSAEIENNNPHTFIFTKQINQYMVGFSKCFIKFSKADHHIKKISIDLSNLKIKNNQITIQPQLNMSDSSDHKESHHSTITVIIIATDSNREIYMHNMIKTDELSDLPLINVKPTFIKSALTCTFAKYSKSDHHIHSYFSDIVPVLDSNYFVLKGQSVIQDQSYHFGNGKVSGGVIIYYGKNKNILCADFDSQKINPDHTGQVGDTQSVCFGDIPKDFNCDDYELGCFISSFQLSYGDSDHHIKQIEISAMLSENTLTFKEGKAFAKVCLKSYMSDEGRNKYDIPHNTVSGFVLAVNKNRLK